jgi:hypothetical protein
MISKDQEHELRAFIAIAEACWRPVNPSYSWHILDWMSYKMRNKYPLVRKSDQIIRFDGSTC